jgi:outer membrane protein OmpA-like peptidoglycan-associated protein
MELANPEEIIKNFRNAAPSAPNVYVTWEPYVSQMLADSEMHLVVDSSKFTGYIVDTLVVSRNFLAKNQATVEQVLESYFTALYEFRDEREKVKLIIEDAEQTGSPLTQDQAQSLVKKIQWKNTQENFAHMGLREGKVFPLEVMIERILNLLKSSGAISMDPTAGQLTRLFYDPPLAQLQTRNFHPGLGSESVFEQGELPPLDETQWGSLVSIGTLNIPDLVFARGSATLTESSQFTLDELVHKLQSWPNYYLRIRGSATKQGNLDANRALANDRAQAALGYLQSRGVSPNRMRVFDGETTGQTRVSFELGQSSF